MRILFLLVLALIIAALLGWHHAVQVERAAADRGDETAIQARLTPLRTTSIRTERDEDAVPPEIRRTAGIPARSASPLAMPGAPANALAWQPHRQDPLASAAVDGAAPLPRVESGGLRVLTERPDQVQPEAFWAPSAARRSAGDGGTAGAGVTQDAVRAAPTREELTAAGRQHLDRGRWQEALQAFIGAARAADNDLGVIAEGAAALCQAQRYDEAFRMRDAYLDSGGNAAHGHYLAGMIRLAMEDPGSAKAEFGRAIAANPTLSEAHFQLGKLAQGENDLAAAETHLRNASFADPNFAETKYRLGVVLSAQGRHGEAETLFREILGRAPGDFATIQKLGATLFSQRRYAEALVCYQALRAVAPDDPDVINQISVTLKRLGRNQDALDYLVQGLEIHPHNFVLRFNAACVLSDMNRIEDALATLDALRRTHPRDLARFIDDPDFAGLRNRPEFQDIRRQVLAAAGMDQAAAAP